MIKEVLYSVVILTVALWSSHAQAVVLQTGDIIVGDRIVGSSVVYKVDPTTGDRTILGDNVSVGSGVALDTINSIAIDTDGTILIVSRGTTPSIIRLDPVTGIRSAVTTSVGSPVGIAVSPSGKIYVTDGISGISGVVEVNGTTGVVTQISTDTAGSGIPTFTAPGAMTFGAGGLMYVTDTLSGADRIVEVDLGTGARTPVPATSTPSFDVIEGGLTFDATGDLLASDFAASRVISADIGTGAHTDVSSSGVGSGTGDASLSAPYQMAIDALGKLIVANSGNDNILSIDLSTGNRTILSGDDGGGLVGTGDAFFRPFGLAIFQSQANASPEPSSIILLIVGLIAIRSHTLRRRRRL